MTLTVIKDNDNFELILIPSSQVERMLLKQCATDRKAYRFTARIVTNISDTYPDGKTAARYDQQAITVNITARKKKGK